MPTRQATSVLRHIRNLFAEHRGVNLPDRQLLEQFALRHDQAAFEALLRRHGPLVMGVCRRVLQNGPDAEDAFQATFLVLARKASSIRKKESVGSWLYQTAYHLAVQARATVSARRRRERDASVCHGCDSHATASADVLDQVSARELLSALDEELQRLPERHRVPLVLCYLEGKTRDEAARQLGWSLGTLKRRLEQGRERMRSRLVRRGLALSAALLTTGLTQGTATATVPAPLAAATVQAALLAAAGKFTAAAAISAQGVALAKQALKAIAMTKLKAGAALLLAVSLVGAATSVLTYGAIARGQPEKPAAQESSLAAAQRLPRAGDPEAAPNEPKNAPLGKPVGAKEETGEKMTVTGRILGADGKPVKDAKVAVVSRPQRRLHAWEWAAFAFDVLDTSCTAGDGRFRLSVPPPSGRVLEPVTLPLPRDERALVASAPGHGLAWRSLDTDPEPSGVLISLPREQTVRSRLIDLQGQPAAGVQLVVARVTSKTPTKDGEGIDFRVPPESLPPWPKPVTTDDQGRFVLRGIGRGQVVTLEVRDDRFARQHLEVKAADKEQSAEGTLVLAPPRLITGRVTHADTGLPVPNARVTVWAHRDIEGSLRGQQVTDRTNAQGRFRINCFPGAHLSVTAFAPEGEPYLNPIKRLEWTKAAVQQEIEIALPRGVLVRGSITEAASGKPVAGATVEFWPRLGSNRDIQSSGTVWITSGPDGSFRMAVPPGPGHLLVNGPVPDYIPQPVGENELHFGKPGGTPSYWHAVFALDLKAEDKTKDIAVTLRRGVTVKGNLVGPDGQPVPRAQMLCGQLPPPQERSIRPVPVRDGHFEMRGCDPEHTYRVLFLTAPYKPGINWIGMPGPGGFQRKLHLPAFFGDATWLGAAVQLSAQQAGGKPIRVPLASCGSAVLRLVSAEGQPLKNFSPPLDLVVTPGPDLNQAWEHGTLAGEVAALNDTWTHWTPVPGVSTDTQGRLTLTGLIPGATYRINNLDRTPAKDFTVPSDGKPAEITVKIK